MSVGWLMHPIRSKSKKLLLLNSVSELEHSVPTRRYQSNQMGHLWFADLVLAYVWLLQKHHAARYCREVRIHKHSESPSSLQKEEQVRSHTRRQKENPIPQQALEQALNNVHETG
jgi:hypothetical protein